ncbi:MAG TPA: hypothetical protein VF403_03615 [Kofleriaceae bacterium]
MLAASTYGAIYLITRNLSVSNAGFAWLALLGLETRVRRSELDERDREIHARASLIGYGIFWVAFVFGCVGFSIATSVVVPAPVIGVFPMVGYWLLEVSRSVAGLTLYARGS